MLRFEGPATRPPHSLFTPVWEVLVLVKSVETGRPVYYGKRMSTWHGPYSPQAVEYGRRAPSGGSEDLTEEVAPAKAWRMGRISTGEAAEDWIGGGD